MIDQFSLYIAKGPSYMLNVSLYIVHSSIYAMSINSH
jgi:hypothetical protein